MRVYKEKLCKKYTISSSNKDNCTVKKNKNGSFTIKLLTGGKTKLTCEIYWLIYNRFSCNIFPSYPTIAKLFSIYGMVHRNVSKGEFCYFLLKHTSIFSILSVYGQSNHTNWINGDCSDDVGNETECR